MVKVGPREEICLHWRPVAHRLALGPEPELCAPGQMEEAGPSGGKSPNSPRLGQLRELWQLRPHETQPLTHLYLRQPVSEKLVPALKVLNSKKGGGQ